MPNQNAQKNNIWVTIGLIAAIFAVLAISFFGADTSGQEDGEKFGGTDSVVVEVLDEHGVTPWFDSLLDLGSGEVESGLFAMQAALGAGLFGFVLGNFRGRTAVKREEEAASKKASS